MDRQQGGSDASSESRSQAAGAKSVTPLLDLPFVHEYLSQASCRAYGLPDGSQSPEPATTVSQMVPFVHELYSQQTRVQAVDGLREQGRLPPEGHGSAPGIGKEDDLSALRALDGSLRVGRYHLLERVGAGGMGVVYRARAEGTGRDLAVKVIRAARFAADRDQARFRAEIANLARLRHPNLCRLHDFGHESGVDYFVMDFIDGLAFERWLEAEQPSIDRIITLIARAAEAVAHANQQGVIHRDLNPVNIMVRAGDDPVIMDFGLARDLDAEQRLTVSGVAVGTPPYMSPEATLGKEGDIGPWTDVWGLGAVLYHALTGHPPFEGSSNHEIFRRINEEDPRAPRSHNGLVPRPLERVIQCCLQKLPGERYPHAGELAADLQRILTGQRVRVALPGPVKRLARRVRRYPIASGLLLSVLLLATLAAAVFWVNHRRQWADWVPSVDVAFDRLDLPEHFSVWDGASRRRATTPTVDVGDGVRFVRDPNSGVVEWLTVRVPGSQHGVRVDLDLEFGELNDAVELVVNASRSPLGDWWHMPAGWQVKIYRDVRPGIFIGWSQASGGAKQWERRLGPGLSGETSTVRVSLIRRADVFEVLLDNRPFASIQRPLALSGSGHDWLMIRAFQATTVLRGLRVHRLGQAQFASPLVAGEVLQGRGQTTAAIEEYIRLAADHSGQIGEAALTRAIALSVEQVRRGRPQELLSLVSQFRAAYPKSLSLPRVLEYAATYHWETGAIDTALSVLEELLERDPDSRHAVVASVHDRFRLTPAQGLRLARLLVRMQDVVEINLSDLKLDDLEMLRGRQLERLWASGNRIRDLSPIRDSGVRSLHLMENQITDLTPLAGLTLLELDLTGNRELSDLTPLRTCDIKSLTLNDCSAITTVPIVGDEGLSRLSMTRCPLPNLDGLQVSRLTALNIAGSSVAVLPALITQAAALRHLNISGTSITDLRPLAPLLLGRLELANTAIGDTDMPPKGSYYHLDVSHSRVTRLQPLLQQVTTELVANGCAFIDADRIASPTLQELFLQDCGLTTWPAFDTPVLRRMDLSGNPFTAVGSMAGMPTIRVLRILRAPLEHLGDLQTRPPAILGVDHRNLAADHRVELGAAWLQAGRSDLTRRLRVHDLITSGRHAELMLEAESLPDGFYLPVHEHLTSADAVTLAERAGAQLAAITDVETQVRFAREAEAGSGLRIGWRIIEGLPVWQNGSTASYRSVLASLPTTVTDNWWLLNGAGGWQADHGEIPLHCGVLLWWPPSD